MMKLMHLDLILLLQEILNVKKVIADEIRTLGEVSIDGSVSIGRAINIGY